MTKVLRSPIQDGYHRKLNLLFPNFSPHRILQLPNLSQLKIPTHRNLTLLIGTPLITTRPRLIKSMRLQTFPILLTIPMMIVRSSIHHLHPSQKLQLPDTNPTMISTPARKPFPRPKTPTSKGKNAHDTQRDGRVVQCLRFDRVDRRQTESDGDEDDPERCDNRNRFRSPTKLEGTSFEVSGISERHGDGDAVAEVETDGSDGGGAVVGDLRAESWEGEEEGAGGAEDDGADGGFEMGVYDVETVGDAAVAGEGEHHP